MSDWKSRLGMVYSTDPDYQYRTCADPAPHTPAPHEQNLRVWLDRRRAGKIATIVRGFAGSDDDLRALATLLKTRCGTGGSAKDGEIIIQGDFRDRLIEILAKEGYKAKKAGG
jgi:translation initiation factor 1